jgi:DNA topoisomerase I
LIPDADRAKQHQPESLNLMRRSQPIADNVHDARAAGLRYVSTLKSGIRRVRRGRGFAYISAAGEVLRNRAALERIRALVIPPAWKGVLICSDPAGHIQAVGWDQRGRKQYKYHSRWREIRDENKYDKMIEFGRVLPRIRAQVRRDLRLPGLARAKVLATVVKLLECSHIRVGNEEYARQNHSFGLTTMRNRHVQVTGSSIHLEFRGKTGIEHVVDVQNARVAKVVRACQHLPGQELFQYVDENQQRHVVGSGDVNDYLHQVAGNGFTAKDFRTWTGTVLAAQALKQMGSFRSHRQAKTKIVQAIVSVAGQLRNTTAVCRKCYIHPAVLNAYLDGTLLRMPDKSASKGLRAEEVSVMSLLSKSASNN